MNEKERIFSRFVALEFAIQETVLFLDTHPEDAEALAYYSGIVEERNRLKAEYEARFGPLTVCGNKSDTKWLWVASPWPWECR